MRSPGRLLALITVLAVALILIRHNTTTKNPELRSSNGGLAPLIRSDLEVVPLPPQPIADNHPSHPSPEDRIPYEVLSPVAPIHKGIEPGDKLGEQILSATVALNTGSLLRNQSFHVELILYRPKPDVIYTGVVVTDEEGRFSISVGNDYQTTTSLSLHMSSTTKAYLTGLLSTTHFAKAPHGEEINLGHVVLFAPSAFEE